MEKYLGYPDALILQMLQARRIALSEAITEMIMYPTDGCLYNRALNQSKELSDLIHEWTSRNDEQIKD